MSTTGANPNLDYQATRIGLGEGSVVFSRFCLKRILGRGGMGVVWLAKDQQLDRDVAVKFMPDLVAGDQNVLQDLRRETRNGMRLTHQNVVTMFDLVEENQSAAIVMEFVNGPHLDAMRRSQPNQVFEASSLGRYVSQLLDALEYAHQTAGMVHRDLKPVNLMVNQDDVLKVTDFGIARNLQDTMSRVSVKLNSAGTLVYMSPQQLMGEAPSASDDIYAFGATVYELLTGKPPFHTGDIATQVESRVPPRMSERRQEFGIQGEAIPEAWEQVVAACLEKNPRERPADIQAIRDGLRGQRFKRGSGDTRARRTTRKKTAAGEAAPGTFTFTQIAITAAAVIAVGGWYFGSHLPAQERHLREMHAAQNTAAEEAQAQKKARAREDLEGSAQLIAKAKSMDPQQFSSAKARKEIWEQMSAGLREVAVAGDAEWEQLEREANRQKRLAEDEENKERADYEQGLIRLQGAIVVPREASRQSDLNSTAKKQAWEKFLTEVQATEFNDDYGTKHKALEEEAAMEYNMWALKALSESPATMVSPNLVVASKDMVNWNSAEKEQIIKRVQTALTSAGYFHGKVDGKHSKDLHEALIAYQQKEQMPATGLIDESLVTRLKVDASRPVIAIASPSRQYASADSAPVRRSQPPPPPPQNSKLQGLSNLLDIGIKGGQFYHSIKGR
ncbi:protein kinase domain-containing protein [Prosthecobacter sp.]|uniref:serine/threonine-protein kinase n=1 Tax=Prosthecobacter sp. TaxID=1965333 RepID=UPI0037838DD0